MRANVRRWYADPKVAEAVFAVFSDGSPTSAWGDDVFARMASRFVGFQTQEEALPLDAPLARHRAPSAGGRGRDLRRIIRRSHDGQRAVQWGPGVCAYNVYPPYGHYEDHVPAVERLVAAFLAEEQPYTLSGAEQRFTNELWLARSDRPSALFSFYPPLGAEFERRHVPLRLEVEVENSGGLAVVATLTRGAESDGVLYTLDIAARATRGIEADVTAVVEWHNRAHQAVNAAFERAITDETRRRLRQV